MSDGPSPKKARVEEAKPESYYKVIDGVKYDRALLEEAEAFAKDGQVSYSEAKRLWADAQDGKGLTDVERQTIEYAMQQLKFSEKATKFLRTLLDVGTCKSYYKMVDGVKYDRQLLEQAEVFAADGQVSIPESEKLLEDALDGKGITDIEKNTLVYAMKTLKFTPKAKVFLNDALVLEKQLSYYKQIDGVKYDRELLEAAEKFAKDGQVSYCEAKHLWENAQDGRGVTETEKRTLEYTMKQLKYSEKATKFMRTHLDAGKHTSYYKVIDGVQYDRELLERAEILAADGQISDADIKTLWEDAKDGKGLTKVEKQTFQHMLKTLKFTDKATEFLKAELVA